MRLPDRHNRGSTASGAPESKPSAETDLIRTRRQPVLQQAAAVWHRCISEVILHEQHRVIQDEAI